MTLLERTDAGTLARGLALLAVVAAGCQSGQSGAPGGSAGTSGAGQGCKDLSGTWDLMAAPPGHAPGTGVIVLGANVSSIAILTTGTPGFGGDKLEYTAQGTKQVTWQQGGSTPRVIMVENTPATVHGGSLPIAVGGQWKFSTSHETCMVNVAADLVTASCLGVGPYDDAIYSYDDIPLYVPTGVNGRAYSATRTAALPSSFGDLGGQWSTRSGNTDHVCTVTLEGGTFTSACNFDRFNGTTTLTIGADCVASGTTQDGVELSARRR